MAQNITLMGASYSNVPAVTLPKTGGGTASFTDVTDTTAAATDVASGKYFYTANGTRTQGTNSGGGGGKNIQVYDGYDETNATSYTATDVSIKINKTGTYKCSWTGLRNTTGGTSGTRLYVNDVAAGSTHTTGWIRSYYQYVSETLSLNKDDVITVYGRARASNYYMVVGNLIAQEQ